MMKRTRIRALLLSGLALLLTGVPAATAQEIQIPTLPDPVAIEVDPATTAFLVMDISMSNCPVRPSCLESLGPIAGFLDRARASGMKVIQTTTGATIMPDVAPVDGELIMTFNGDKFNRTNLEDILRNAGVDTVIVVGSASNVAVMI